MTHNPSQAEVQAMAAELTRNRSRSVVRALAERFKVAESFVEMVAESVVARKFNFEDTSSSSTAPAPTSRDLQRAEDLKEAVDRAEAKEPHQWSHQDIEALLAARY